MEEKQQQGQALTEETQTSITQLGSSVVGNDRGNIHVLTLVGQVEGHQVLGNQCKATKYEHIMPLLATVEGDPKIDGLLVLLNTMGGDVEAGLAIAELISSMTKPTVSLVLGGGHSIGVPLAVSSKRSFIVPSGAMTLHPVRLNGFIIAVPQTFHYFQRIQQRIMKFITVNSHIEEAVLEELMLRTGELASDVGSVIYGEEAVELGLIDEIGGLSQAMDCLYQMIEQEREDRGL